VLAAGANAVAAVRSPKTSRDLQDLKLQHPEALTIVAMDAGVFPSVKVRAFAYKSFVVMQFCIF
jgi:hypothetical protein